LFPGKYFPKISKTVNIVSWKLYPEGGHVSQVHITRKFICFPGNILAVFPNLPNAIIKHGTLDYYRKKNPKPTHGLDDKSI
jgi:hypothetical protein